MKNRLTASIMLRSTIFWILAAGVLPFYNLMVLFIWPFPARFRHAAVMSAATYFTFLLKVLAGIKYQVTGIDNLPKEPAIIAGNHQSAWETVAFNCIFPASVWIMKREVLQIPFYGWGVRALSPIAINRAKGDDALAQMIRQGKQRFAKGFWITVFPEGTRVRPKKRKSFKFGSAKLALKLGVPIIPVAHNAGYCLPKNSFWIYPGMVSIVVGKPIYPDNDDPITFTHKVENWVHEQLDLLGA